MLSPALEDRIRTLLLEGRLSQREIARLTGTSRSTVAAIADGHRNGSLRQTADDRTAYFSTASRPRRCPQCGGMVFMPCHLCRVRAYAMERTLAAAGANAASGRASHVADEIPFVSAAVGEQSASCKPPASSLTKASLSRCRAAAAPNCCPQASKSLTNS